MVSYLCFKFFLADGISLYMRKCVVSVDLLRMLVVATRTYLCTQWLWCGVRSKGPLGFLTSLLLARFKIMHTSLLLMATRQSKCERITISHLGRFWR
jgi:hypothetical protein